MIIVIVQLWEDPGCGVPNLPIKPQPSIIYISKVSYCLQSLFISIISAGFEKLGCRMVKDRYPYFTNQKLKLIEVKWFDKVTQHFSSKDNP